MDPVAGLSECRRIIKNTGSCIYTVPIIIGRLSRSRNGLKDSYHGCSEEHSSDYVVHTEFGADVWRYAMDAGFSSVHLHAFEYPSALAIEASKR